MEVKEMKYKIILLLLIAVLQGCVRITPDKLEKGVQLDDIKVANESVVETGRRSISTPACIAFSIYENDTDLFLSSYNYITHRVEINAVTTKFNIKSESFSSDYHTDSTITNATNAVFDVITLPISLVIDGGKALLGDNSIPFTEEVKSKYKLSLLKEISKSDACKIADGNKYKGVSKRSGNMFSISYSVTHDIIDNGMARIQSLNIEYVGYSKIRKAYYAAIQGYDTAIIHKGNIPDLAMFINSSVFVDAIRNANSKQQMLALRKIANHIGYTGVDRKIEEKIYGLDFNRAYNLAKESSIDVKRQFIKKYANYSKGKHEVKKIRTSIFNEVRIAVLQSSNITVVSSYYYQHKSDIKVRDKLLAMYRNSNEFNNLIKAYDISQSKADIKSAYLVAVTRAEKTIVEAKLLKTLSPNKFVKVDVLGSSESALREASSSSLVHSFRGMVRDYNRTIRISFDPTSGMPVKYGRYKVNVEMKLNLEYSNPINGKNKDFDSKSMTVLLTPENNYSATMNLSYKNIAVNGKYHLLAATMLSGLANMFGANMDSSDMDIAIDLNDTKLTSNIISVTQN